MISHLLPLTTLLMGVSFLLVGTGLLTSLLSIRAGLEGFDTQALGLLGTAFFAGYLAGNRLAPALIRRIGHIRAFSFFTAAIACMNCCLTPGSGLFCVS